MYPNNQAFMSLNFVCYVLSGEEGGGQQQNGRLDISALSFFPDDNTIGDTAKTVKAPLGVEVLFGTFKEWGYQTLYQEDLCWYDRWGIGLTDLEMRGVPKGYSEFKERYGGRSMQ